jgi:hypothetical protein
MRRQDELASLYPVSDAMTRQYVIDQVPELPIHFDSDEIEDLLDRARREKEPAVAAHALVAWDRVGADLTLYAHGLCEERLGLWSAVSLSTRRPEAPAQPAQPARPARPAHEARGSPVAPLGAEDVAGTAADSEERASASGASAGAEALAELLEPCRGAVLAAAARPGPPGDLAREILGFLPFAASEEALLAGARDPSCALTALLALARRARGLAAATLARERKLPPWIRALASGAVGGHEGLREAATIVRSGDEQARWAVALALPSLAGEDLARLAGSLMDAERGWVQVAVLDSLGRIASGPPCAAGPAEPTAPAGRGGASSAGAGTFESEPEARELLRLMDRGLKHAQHDLVRIAAVRAMGSIRHELAAKRAMRCLERGSPLLQAAAIEALVRLDCDDPRFAEHLRARAAAGPVKLRGVAVLGLLKLDREAALRHAIELVRSGEVTPRLEGAFCLGYLQCRTSVAVLSVLAREESFTPGALQAIKSLAHFPETEVSPVLAGLLDHSSPPVAMAALRVLSHFPGEAQPELVPALESLADRLQGADLASMLRHCGRLGPARSGVSGFLQGRLARAGAGSEARSGALRGLALAGEPPPPLAQEAAAAGSGALAAHAALALLVGGQCAGAEALACCLASPDAAVHALAAVRELAVIAGEAGRGGRHRRLQALLAPRRRAPEAHRGVPASRPLALRHIARPMSALPVRAKDSPDVLRRTAGIDRDELVKELSGTLARGARAGDPGARARSALHWIQDLTTIQTQGLALLAGARALAHPALLAAVAAAALLSVAVSAWSGAGQEAAHPVDPAQLDPALLVSGVVGSPRKLTASTASTAGAAGDPLFVGSPVGAGDVIRAAAGERVSLSSMSGLSLVLFPSGELRLSTVPSRTARDAEARLVLELAAGAVVVDTRLGTRSGAVVLKAGPGELSGDRVAARAALERGQLVVHLAAGKATLTSRAGAGEIEIGAFQTAAVPASGPPGSPTFFRLTDVEWR